jgi:hypothetical protein
MIWVVRQFITHQILEAGPERVNPSTPRADDRGLLRVAPERRLRAVERVKFSIRVEVEYQEEKERVSGGSLRKKVIYNKSFLMKRYPHLKEQDLELLVDQRVQMAIEEYLATPDRNGSY